MSALLCLCHRSMLPDVVDDFAARHPSVKDLEPLFFSCYAFCSKLAGGLSVGISTMTLQWVTPPSAHFSLLRVCICWSVRFFLFFSSSPVLWATERLPVTMATEWWRLWLCCSRRFPSRCCWWGWSSFAPTQSMRGNLYSSTSSRPQLGEWQIKPLGGWSRHAVFKAAVMEPFT